MADIKVDFKTDLDLVPGKIEESKLLKAVAAQLAATGSSKLDIKKLVGVDWQLDKKQSKTKAKQFQKQLNQQADELLLLAQGTSNDLSNALSQGAFSGKQGRALLKKAGLDSEGQLSGELSKSNVNFREQLKNTAQLYKRIGSDLVIDPGTVRKLQTSRQLADRVLSGDRESTKGFRKHQKENLQSLGSYYSDLGAVVKKGTTSLAKLSPEEGGILTPQLSAVSERLKAASKEVGQVLSSPQKAREAEAKQRKVEGAKRDREEAAEAKKRKARAIRQVKTTAREVQAELRAAQKKRDAEARKAEADRLRRERADRRVRNAELKASLKERNALVSAGLKKFAKQQKEDVKLGEADQIKKAARGIISEGVAGRTESELEGNRRALQLYQSQLKKASAESIKSGKSTKALSKEMLKVDTALAQTNRKLSTFNTVASDSGRVLNQFFRYALGYGALYKLLGLFNQLTTGVIDFDTQLKSIQAVTGATVQQIGNIRGSISAVALQTRFVVTDIAQAAKTLGQAGVDPGEIEGALRASAVFAAATDSAISVSADLLTTMRNVFKDLNDDVLADLLTRAINISKLTGAGLKTILGIGAQVADRFNLSAEQFLSAITVLKNRGFKDSTAATGFRQGLLEIFSPDTKTVKVLVKRYAAIGEELSEAQARARFQAFTQTANPLQTALQELQKLGFSGSGAADFARAYDVRALNAIQALASNMDELAAAETKLTFGKASAEASQIQMESLSASLDNLGAAFTVLGEQVTRDGVGALETFVDSLTETIKAISDADLELKIQGKPGLGPLAGGSVAAGAAAALTARTGLAGKLVTGGLVAGGSFVAGEEAIREDGNKAVSLIAAVVTALTIFSAISSLIPRGAIKGLKVSGLGGTIKGILGFVFGVDKIDGELSGAIKKSKGKLGKFKTLIGSTGTFLRIGARFAGVIGILFTVYEALSFLFKLTQSENDAAALKRAAEAANEKYDRAARDSRQKLETANQYRVSTGGFQAIKGGEGEAFEVFKEDLDTTGTLLDNLRGKLGGPEVAVARLKEGLLEISKLPALLDAGDPQTESAFRAEIAKVFGLSDKASSVIKDNIQELRQAVNTVGRDAARIVSFGENQAALFKRVSSLSEKDIQKGSTEDLVREAMEKVPEAVSIVLAGVTAAGAEAYEAAVLKASTTLSEVAAARTPELQESLSSNSISAAQKVQSNLELISKQFVEKGEAAGLDVLDHFADTTLFEGEKLTAAVDAIAEGAKSAVDNIIEQLRELAPKVRKKKGLFASLLSGTRFDPAVQSAELEKELRGLQGTLRLARIKSSQISSQLDERNTSVGRGVKQRLDSAVSRTKGEGAEAFREFFKALTPTNQGKFSEILKAQAQGDVSSLLSTDAQGRKVLDASTSRLLKSWNSSFNASIAAAAKEENKGKGSKARYIPDAAAKRRLLVLEEEIADAKDRKAAPEEFKKLLTEKQSLLISEIDRQASFERKNTTDKKAFDATIAGLQFRRFEQERGINREVQKYAETYHLQNELAQKSLEDEKVQAQARIDLALGKGDLVGAVSRAKELQNIEDQLYQLKVEQITKEKLNDEERQAELDSLSKGRKLSLLSANLSQKIYQKRQKDSQPLFSGGGVGESQEAAAERQARGVTLNNQQRRELFSAQMRAIDQINLEQLGLYGLLYRQLEGATDATKATIQAELQSILQRVKEGEVKKGSIRGQASSLDDQNPRGAYDFLRVGAQTESILKQQDSEGNIYLREALGLTDQLTDAFINAKSAGESVGDAMKEVFRNMALEIAKTALQALILRTIMGAFGLNAATPNTPVLPTVGAATGGIIRGRGTSTSDSIYGGVINDGKFTRGIAVSNGESILNAKATSALGDDFIHRANAGRLKVSPPSGVPTGLATAIQSLGQKQDTRPPEVNISNHLSGEVVEDYLSSRRGSTVVKNIVRSNKSNDKVRLGR